MFQYEKSLSRRCAVADASICTEGKASPCQNMTPKGTKQNAEKNPIRAPYDNSKRGH